MSAARVKDKPRGRGSSNTRVGWGRGERGKAARPRGAPTRGDIGEDAFEGPNDNHDPFELFASLFLVPVHTTLILLRLPIPLVVSTSGPNAPRLCLSSLLSLLSLIGIDLDKG